MPHATSATQLFRNKVETLLTHQPATLQYKGREDIRLMQDNSLLQSVCVLCVDSTWGVQVRGLDGFCLLFALCMHSFLMAAATHWSLERTYCTAPVRSLPIPPHRHLLRRGAVTAGEASWCRLDLKLIEVCDYSWRCAPQLAPAMDDMPPAGHGPHLGSGPAGEDPPRQDCRGAPAGFQRLSHPRGVRAQPFITSNLATKFWLLRLAGACAGAT